MHWIIIKKQRIILRRMKPIHAEALFLAAYLADRVMKNQKEAIALYKELKEKYPKTQQGFEADNYLAQLGVYNVN